MLVDGISRRQLQDMAIKTLIDANTMALDRVYEPRSWPTKPDQFPMLLVQTPRDRKVAMGRGLPQFTTTITLVVVGRVIGYTPEIVNDALDQLSDDIENALFCTLDFVSRIQQFETVETQTTVSADGKQIVGEIGVAFECEVYQVFAPTGVPLIGVDATITNGPGGTDMATVNIPLPVEPTPTVLRAMSAREQILASVKRR
jgi:hypothetical protein